MRDLNPQPRFAVIHGSHTPGSIDSLDLLNKITGKHKPVRDKLSVDTEVEAHLVLVNPDNIDKVLKVARHYGQKRVLLGGTDGIAGVYDLENESFVTIGEFDIQRAATNADPYVYDGFSGRFYGIVDEYHGAVFTAAVTDLIVQLWGHKPTTERVA